MLNERFWSKVDRSAPGGCWVWTANKNNMGYGLFRPGGTAPKRLAHRLSYAAAKGTIPEGMCVLHRCDNPACVRPAHLFLGTKADNARDMDAKGRRRVSLHPENLGPPKRGAAHHAAKLTEERVREIRRRRAGGDAIRALAREYGVDRATIQAVVKRESWRHVP